MPQVNIAPTKSNLIKLKERLQTAREGYELLEQKREILVIELMRLVEEVRILEKALQSRIDQAYSALRRLLLKAGRQAAAENAQGAECQYAMREERRLVAGISLPRLEVRAPEAKLAYSFGNSFAECDDVMLEFTQLAGLAAQMASLKSCVWRLAREVKKTQRRVNALEKMVIPNTLQARGYIEGVLEERDREAIFVQKVLKSRRLTGGE